jgi:hypothetical protein
MGARDRIGTAVASSCCRAAGERGRNPTGLADDGQNGRCGALGQFGHGSGLDRQLKCHMTNLFARAWETRRTPGLWRVEYLLSNHSSKSITAAT